MFWAFGDPPETAMASGSVKKTKRDFYSSPRGRHFGVHSSAWRQICMTFYVLFDKPFGRHFAHCVRQRDPKGTHKGTILTPLGGSGGNVKTMVQGVLRDFLCSALRAMFFKALLGTTFCGTFYRFCDQMEVLCRPLGLTFS